MKQKLPTTESKTSSFQYSPATATRARVLRTKDSPGLESPNGVSPVLKARPKHVTLEANNTPKARRSIPLNKPKMASDCMGAPKEREREDSKLVGRSRIRVVKQYAQLQGHVDGNHKGSEDETDGNENDLKRRLDASESLVKGLELEVSTLKAQLERLQSINVKLQSHNRQFAEDLTVAEAKIATLEKQLAKLTNQEIGPPNFRNVQELTANELNNLKMKKEIIKEDTTTKMQSFALEPGAKAVEFQPKVLRTGHPPPPPPPPPCRAPPRATTKQKATSLEEFYHSLTKRARNKEPLGSGNCASPVVINAHLSIVGELQNRSSHLLAIKADVENKGGFINNLIERVQTATFTDMEGVLAFVGWLDGELSTLADERAVLKHFNWPERKADSLREAAFGYRDLKKLQAEVSSFKNDVSLPYEATLKKIASLQDKLERSIHRLVKLRDANMISYREYKIPTDWMLDPGMASKIKQASGELAKLYMKRVSVELELAQHSERESVQEALIYQGVRFSYRAYQFAGGLDSEAMYAFEGLRKQVESHGRGSRESLHGKTIS